MNTFFFVVLTLLSILMLVYLYRVVRGPSVYDRVLGLNGMSTKAIVIIVLLGTIFERVDMFVDISTGYALLNLVGALAITKFLEKRGQAQEVDDRNSTNAGESQ
ncbi:MAG: monovalent cation/H+ antiporter complex subunit F [Kangiellaceae bacterium]|jgi:multicomponent Na+:H+ antiporter subunit F|nr:monovalent cation/H+ antiporter complex subunit F [Kangiellaceae bacterium]